MKKLKNIIIGVLLIAVGIIWGLNAAGVTNIDIFFDGWWTLFIIVPCAISLFTGSDKIGSLLGIAVGVLLLLASQEVFGFDVVWKAVVPLIIVSIGLKIILKAIFPPKQPEFKADNQKAKNHSAVFGGEEINFSGEEFYGANLTAVFGGVDCDLREAVINDGAVITATAIFGGVDLILPPDVKVKVSSTSIFGGIDHNKNRKTDDNAPTIYINGTCIFGGVEIK